jgi:cyclase
MRRRVVAAVMGVALCVPGAIILAQGGAAGLEVLQVRPNFYMIAGAGANIGAQIGPNGVILVNAGTAAASGSVLAAVRTLSDQPIRYIINTSADPDVVGGNDALARAGRNISSFAGGSNRITILGTDLDIARVLSHENILRRLRLQLAPSELWPSETFEERRRTMYFNDEGIEILHQPAAHSDGDTIVFFRKSDVIVAGHIIDTTRFPVIDLARGGSINGEIDALNRVIELAIPPGPFIGLPAGPTASARQQGGTEVLTGRGRIYRQIDVVNYRDMVVIVRDIVQDMINRKMTLDQIKAADPAKPYTAQYGATSGPWTTSDFVDAIYRSLTNATS